MNLSTNWTDKTIWTGDNLPIMRGMNSESVDLIYLDPPFNSNANYAAPIGSKAAGAEFKDTWTLNDINIAWLDLIETKHPQLNRVIQASMSNSDKAYLIYMAVRLLELKRLLKPTGSIYLHCDPTMSHYLKLVMDAIFGPKNFKNEIVWKRNTSHNDSTIFGKVADYILFYGQKINKNAVRIPLDADYVKKHYRHWDPSRGHYTADNLSAKGLSGGGYFYDFYGHQGPWRYPEIRMKELDKQNRIHISKEGNVPRLKRFLSENKGKVPTSIWLDIPPVQGRSKESTKYPTQKPLKLLARIIEASSNKGDLVFDPFCGCATTCVAADRLERQWAGIDISSKAVELVKDRIRQDQGIFQKIIARTDVPQRTDLGKLPPYQSHKQTLYGYQGGNCNGCFEHFKIQNLTVDHIIPKSGGGTDHIGNLQLLCGYCNSVKGDRGMDYLKSKLHF